ncbi:MULTISPECIES: hypothetical protein [Arthrobacter]|nr:MULTISPECIES: hypothetical protein [Arthrobacter]
MLGTIEADGISLEGTQMKVVQEIDRASACSPVGGRRIEHGNA